MAFLPGALPDKSAYTEGSSPVTPVGGEWNDASAGLTSGQTAAIRITEKRSAHVNLRREDGTEIGTATTPLKVDGSAVTQPTQDAADGTPGSAAPSKALLVAGSDGTNLRALLATAAGALKIDGSGVTQPISGTITANAGSGTFGVQDVADGTPGSGAPGKALLVGGSDGTNLRSLALDTSGRQKVLLSDGSGNALSSTSGALNVQEYVTYSSAVASARLRANQVLVTGITAPATLNLFTGSPSYFIESIYVAVFTAPASASTLSVVDSVAGNVLIFGIVPSSQQYFSPPGFFWNAKNSASVCKLVFAGAASLQLYVTVNYGLCSLLS